MPGIIPEAIALITNEYKNYKNGKFAANYELKIQFLEIYNDSISDLLATFGTSN